MFAAFDIISDLYFGESFNGLSSGEYHPWISKIFKSLKLAQIMASLSYLPPLDRILDYLTPSSARKMMEDHVAYSTNQIDKRIERKSDRPDIMKFILENNHSQELLHRIGNGCSGELQNPFGTLRVARNFLGPTRRATPLGGRPNC